MSIEQSPFIQIKQIYLFFTLARQHYTYHVELLPHIWIQTSDHQLWCYLCTGALLSVRPVLRKKPYMFFVLGSDKIEEEEKKKKKVVSNDDMIQTKQTQETGRKEWDDKSIPKILSPIFFFLFPLFPLQALQIPPISGVPFVPSAFVHSY